MFSLGWQETVFIFVLALLIFGPKKLPELGKTVGKALTEFRRASSELKSTFDREMASIEQENQSLKQATSEYVSDTSSYDSSYYDGEYHNYDSTDSTTPESSTVGAAADQGADSNAGSTPEGAPQDGNGSQPSQPAQVADFQI